MRRGKKIEELSAEYMDSRTDIQPNSKACMTSERTNSSVQISLHRPKVYQVRQKLVLLLVTMFVSSIREKKTNDSFSVFLIS